ncbi:hypothetical protein B0T10DRAFT_465761 [Thelonectria olida]|uniref:Cation efflux protein transmembrane domain-containing protein n=1 Tax=Thelonectria olida TaxID=1576542 RepID=A0A9P8VT72_9HYPO|nr:hypothetical protein B0T10DRAFT_465761 [Thelonectria olida]
MCATNTSQHPHKSSPVDLRVRAIQLGIMADFCLTGLKLVGGWAFESSSLATDGWHSASDLATDTIALVVVWTGRHAHTSRRSASVARLFECAASLLASSALVALGLHIAWENTAALRLHFFYLSSGLDEQIDASDGH